jgi:hypothetical protein
LQHHHKHSRETVYYTTPHGTSPSNDVKSTEPAQAPTNAPVPPTPDKA